jgi:hypothetical protein
MTTPICSPVHHRTPFCWIETRLSGLQRALLRMMSKKSGSMSARVPTTPCETLL